MRLLRWAKKLSADISTTLRLFICILKLILALLEIFD